MATVAAELGHLKTRIIEKWVDKIVLNIEKEHPAERWADEVLMFEYAYD